MPIRIQLSRAKGWRKPENTIVVSRPSKWGNPFYTAEAFEKWLSDDAWSPEDVAPSVDTYGMNGLELFNWLNARRDAILKCISELSGKNVACWCNLSDRCHADVLLRLANTALEKPTETIEWYGS